MQNRCLPELKRWQAGGIVVGEDIGKSIVGVAPREKCYGTAQFSFEFVKRVDNIERSLERSTMWASGRLFGRRDCLTACNTFKLEFHILAQSLLASSRARAIVSI